MKFWEDPRKIRKTIDNSSNNGKIGSSRIVLIRIYTFLPKVDKIEGESGKIRKNY